MERFLQMCPRPRASSRIDFSVHGLLKDITLVAAGARWSSTGNPGLQGLRPCAVAAGPNSALWDLGPWALQFPSFLPDPNSTCILAPSMA